MEFHDLCLLAILTGCAAFLTPPSTTSLTAGVGTGAGVARIGQVPEFGVTRSLRRGWESRSAALFPTLQSVDDPDSSGGELLYWLAQGNDPNQDVIAAMSN